MNRDQIHVNIIKMVSQINGQFYQNIEFSKDYTQPGIVDFFVIYPAHDSFIFAERLIFIKHYSLR